jgi:hypothetical protein
MIDACGELNTRSRMAARPQAKDHFPEDAIMKKVVAPLTAILFCLPALAQTQSPATPAPATPSSSGIHQPPLEPAPPANGPTSSIEPAPASSGITTPQVETSGGSGMQSEAGLDNSPPPSPTARLKPQVQNNVTYLCGGVGQEEASFMKQEARGYGLMLTFAARDGSYLADVNVDIKDARGKPVLQTSCDSPILLVSVPTSGVYRIHADAAGYVLNRTAKVQAKRAKGARLASVAMVWPQQVAEMGGATATTGGGAAGTVGSGGSGGSGTR